VTKSDTGMLEAVDDVAGAESQSGLDWLSCGEQSLH